MLPNNEGATMAASVAMIAIVTSSSMSVNPRRAPRAAKDRRELILYDTCHLLHCSESRLHFVPTVRAQRNESGVRREQAKLCARRTRGDRIAHVVSDAQHLEDSQTPAIPSAPARRTTGAA